MKKSFIFSISLIFILSLFSPQVSHASDINQHWAKYDIEELVNKGIMGGYGNDIYLPNKNVSRAEFTQLVLKALNIQPTNATTPFQDVTKGDWFYDSVVTAADIGLVNGTSSTTFSPNKAITRQDISVIITSALALKGINTIESSELFLDDNTISAYAKPSVKGLHHLGIVAGKIKGANNKYYFKPFNQATRAEAAVMLVRMLHVIERPSEIIRNVAYQYDFKQMVDKQMASGSRPQADYSGPWYDASRAMVEYYANPNNFRNQDTNIYQFLVLSGSSGIPAQNLNEKILYNKGVLKGNANAFIRASEVHNINEIYLIAHSLLETGNGTSKLATGIEVGLNKKQEPTVVTSQNRGQLTNIKKTYNLFGIGAYDHCPNECGSERAYKLGWFTVEEAILGGAEFISNDYIGAGQDTIYKMRWNPAQPAWHQYATDVGWATKQTKRIKEMFAMVNGLGGNPLVFEIPNFNNQPKSSTRPSDEAIFNIDQKFANKKATIKGSNSRVRTGPHTSFPALGNVLKNGAAVTIIGHNTNWYKIKTSSAEGWIRASYLNLPKRSIEPVEVSEAALETAVVNDNEDSDTYLATVNDDGTPLYSEPSTENNVITELNSGTEIIILDENEEQYKVYVNDGTSGETGWMHKQYIMIN